MWAEDQGGSVRAPLVGGLPEMSADPFERRAGAVRVERCEWPAVDGMPEPQGSV
jgi:hypothetical protein